jgi:hypothetical protein
MLTNSTPQLNSLTEQLAGQQQQQQQRNQQQQTAH